MWLRLAVEETQVIQQVLRGDVQSFRLLVDRYQRPVIRIIKSITNDSDMSQDIAQDVFLTAYKKLRTFDFARSRFSTWLFTITRNKSLNALKKKRPVSMSQLPDKTDGRDPYGDLSEKEFFDKVDRILLTLPDRQKTAFVLAEFEELSHAQIAQIEGVRIGTIKSRISRAKEKLRAALESLDGDIL